VSRTKFFPVSLSERERERESKESGEDSRERNRKVSDCEMSLARLICPPGKVMVK
jgi:hypothetical protein